MHEDLKTSWKERKSAMLLLTFKRVLANMQANNVPHLLNLGLIEESSIGSRD